MPIIRPQSFIERVTTPKKISDRVLLTNNFIDGHAAKLDQQKPQPILLKKPDQQIAPKVTQEMRTYFSSIKEFATESSPDISNFTFG